MIVDKIIGNISSLNFDGEIDYLDLEWYEASKRIYRKESRGGRAVAVRFLSENVRLVDGDILMLDNNCAVVVNILECEAIVLSPKTMVEMATLCYEIGNKHMPIFLEQEQVIMPYETPMFRWLECGGYNPEVKNKKLLSPLKSNVAPHSHSLTQSDSTHSESLFTKVVNFASKISQS